MTPDEVMSEEIRLGALEQHIAEALKREDLPMLTAAHFRAQLGKVSNARAALALANCLNRIAPP